MNILAICPGYIPSVMLCGDSQLEYLKKNEKLNYKFLTPKEVTEDDLLWLDILYVIRGDSSYCLKLAKWLKKHKKTVIYVLDDNLLEIPSNLSASKYYLKKSTQRSIRKLIMISDGFISPSKYLIEKYGTSKHKILQIIEPSINPITEKQANNIAKIGFAGSIDHANDIDNMLKDVFIELKTKYKDSISIELFGPKTNVSDELGIKYLPYMDSYSSYQEKMRELNWDIGLGPLEDSKFNQYKHYNKLVEYETYGIAGVYSNVYPYKFRVRDKENGLLTENDKESWINSISSLIDDFVLRQNIQKQCLAEASTIYSLDTSANELYNYLLLFKLNKKNASKGLLRVRMKCWKACYFVKTGRLIKFIVNCFKILALKCKNSILKVLQRIKRIKKKLFNRH